MNELIVTADDFGLAPEVNEAVEIAHTSGILTAASLMVSGPAVEDAVARARRLPTLGVGLHLVLLEGRPVLPADEVPDLVDASGRFRTDMVRASFELALRPAMRRQLAAEIEAQFAAFQATGLPLSHVDAHKQFHVHPIIARILIDTGIRYGMPRLRVPVEPADVLGRVERTARSLDTRLAGLYARRLRARVRKAGVAAPDAVFGLAWSGAMTEARLQGLLEQLPPGRIEIYTHPATADDFAGHERGYRYGAELAALTAPAVVEAADRARR